MLDNEAVFTVQLGDVIVFQPCGDSEGTNLIYTDNKEVFEQCVPQSDVPSDAAYYHIGDCVDNSWSSDLRLYLVNPGLEGQVLYLFSDHASECNDGLKATVIVASPNA